MRGDLFDYLLDRCGVVIGSLLFMCCVLALLAVPGLIVAGALTALVAAQ